MKKYIKILFVFMIFARSIFCIDFDSKKFINSLYIGEAFKTGEIYLEKFEENSKSKFPKKLKFVGVKNHKTYNIKIIKILEDYIGNIEDSTEYFYKPFSKPIQYVGKYKTSNKIDQEIGIALFDYDIEYIDITNKDKFRKYSKKEYDMALESVKEDKKIEPKDRSLNYITIDNTIIKAKEYFRMKIKNTDIEIVFYNYFTNGIEYVGEVYVIDVYSNNKLLKTYEKFNLDGPY